MYQCQHTKRAFRNFFHYLCGSHKTIASIDSTYSPYSFRTYQYQAYWNAPCSLKQIKNRRAKRSYLIKTKTTIYGPLLLLCVWHNNNNNNNRILCSIVYTTQRAINIFDIRFFSVYGFLKYRKAKQQLLEKNDKRKN